MYLLTGGGGGVDQSNICWKPRSCIMICIARILHNRMLETTAMQLYIVDVSLLW